jgi:hypothetical protein
MSSSSGQQTGSRAPTGLAETAELRIESPAGVDYRVFNGQGDECFRGSGDQQITLTQGLYAIHWFSAGMQQETLLRVAARNRLTLATFPRDMQATGAGADAASEPLAQQLTATTPTLSPEMAMVSIIVRRVTSPGEAEASPSSCSGLKLLDERSREQENDPAPEAHLSLQANEVARHFSVKPGDYLLSFRSVTGETLQQSVPALPGRHTLIFQEEFRAKVFVAEGEVFRDQWKYGVDPSRTIIISVNGLEEHERIRERLRLAEILLHDIATGSTSFDPKFIGILDDPRTDPLLRLLGAIVAIRDLLSAGKVTAPESVNPVSAEQALRWLSLDKGLSIAPDETVARWQLNILLGDRRNVRSRRNIGHPPMLEIVWRWALAIRQSNAEQGTIAEKPATRAATSAAISAGAWLCWRASATKAAESSILSRVEMNARIQDLVRKVSQVASKTKLADGLDISNILTLDLPNGAQAMLKAVLTPENQSMFGSLLEKNPRLGQIFAQMEQLSTALANSGSQIADSMPTSPEQAPGLLRMVVFPDDPNKARFGGTSAREGFILSASFANTRQPGWTRITLTVNGPAHDSEVIRLYLHESFPNSVQDLVFSGQKASTNLLAWGGFTVGGWLPQRGIELELDLTECDGAPEPIRTR